MTKALHVIAKQEGIAPKGITQTERKGTYRSNCWVHLADPYELLNGWLYVHETSGAPSKMGGRIEAIEPCMRDPDKYSIKDGWAFVFSASERGKGVIWRGYSQPRPGHGGIVDATLEHELAEF